jgi:DNA-binding beta-propeller fold protein YncE
MFRNNLFSNERSEDHTTIAKGLFLSVLVVSSALPIFAMTSAAAPVKAIPNVISTIPGFSEPTGIAYDPVNKKMYVTNFGVGANTVTILYTNTNTVSGPPVPVG